MVLYVFILLVGFLFLVKGADWFVEGAAGIAIGNIVGSNIFNILFVIGITALICNVPFESKFLIDTAIAIFSGALLWLGTYKHKELRKPCGIVMLVCYAAYFVYLCVL